MLNGQLPNSVLGPIAQGRLRKDAAAAWNAMNTVSRRKYGVTMVPMGGMSSYRTYAQQVYLYRVSRPGWAARPGTSNHGWGLAVDLRTRQMRAIVDVIGGPFGWAKRWSDASFEWWHLKYKSGVWRGHVGPNYRPNLRHGDSGKRVRKLQRILRRHGMKSVRVTGYFGVATRRAVKRIQKKHHLKTDGVVGARTWKLLR